MRRFGRPRVVHNALQFLHARQPPVVVAEKFSAFFFCTQASASCQFMPWPLSAFDHIKPVARSVMVPSLLSWKLFLP